MKNETIKKVITTVSIILTSAIIMLIPQLIHAGFQLTAVDWQPLVVSSLMIDICVYLGFLQASLLQNTQVTQTTLSIFLK